METHLSYLAWSALLCIVMWLPYVLERAQNWGLVAALGYPENPPDPAPWAQRLKKAKNERLKNRAELLATTPKFWMGAEAPDMPGISRRYILARWITGDENEAFSKTAVNRLWAVLMGRGIVHPVDMFG